jgi:hypothetical protein
MNGTGSDFSDSGPVVREDLMYIELSEEKSDICLYRFSVYKVYQKGFEQVKKLVSRHEADDYAWTKATALEYATELMKVNFITLQITKEI